MPKKKEITKPANPSQSLTARLEELEDEIRQIQAAAMNLPTVDDIPADMLTLADVLNIASEGGEVTGFQGAFAKANPSGTCFWDELYTWREFLDAQYPHIVPVEVGGSLYFGCNPNGVYSSATELLALQQSGVELLTAEQYRAATQPANDNP